MLTCAGVINSIKYIFGRHSYNVLKSKRHICSSGYLLFTLVRYQATILNVSKLVSFYNKA